MLNNLDIGWLVRVLFPDAVCPFFRLIQAVASDFIVEKLAADAEPFRGLSAIAAGALKRTANHLRLDPRDRVGKRSSEPVGCRRGGSRIQEIEVGRGQDSAAQTAARSMALRSS